MKTVRRYDMGDLMGGTNGHTHRFVKAGGVFSE
jgi:hypothetical protein